MKIHFVPTIFPIKIFSETALGVKTSAETLAKTRGGRHFYLSVCLREMVCVFLHRIINNFILNRALDNVFALCVYHTPTETTNLSSEKNIFRTVCHRFLFWEQWHIFSLDFCHGIRILSGDVTVFISQLVPKTKSQVYHLKRCRFSCHRWLKMKYWHISLLWFV